MTSPESHPVAGSETTPGDIVRMMALELEYEADKPETHYEHRARLLARVDALRSLSSALSLERSAREAAAQREREALDAHNASFGALDSIRLLLNQDDLDDYQAVVRGVEALSSAREAAEETVDAVKRAWTSLMGDWEGAQATVARTQKMLMMVEASEAARMEHIAELQSALAASEAAREAAERERDEAERVKAAESKNANYLFGRLASSERQTATLRAEFDELLGELLVWGGHNHDCWQARRRNPTVRCLCGWDHYRERMEVVRAALGSVSSSASPASASEASPGMCEKARHFGGGYLHDENDDSPFDVDGVTYCGRCHGPVHGWMAAPSSSSIDPSGAT